MPWSGKYGGQTIIAIVLVLTLLMSVREAIDKHNASGVRVSGSTSAVAASSPKLPLPLFPANHNAIARGCRCV